MRRMHRKTFSATVLLSSTLLAASLLALRPGDASAGSPAQSAPVRELSVERIWGQPSLSGRILPGLTWSPDGKLLGFLHHSGEGASTRTDFSVIDAATGVRRVLISAEKLAAFLEPPAPAGGAVTAQSQATGQGRVAPTQFLWAPDGNAILFAKESSLYWFDLKSQTAKRLTALRAKAGATEAAVEDPKISPNGKWVSFTRNYNLWVADVASGKETQLTGGGSEDLRKGVLDWVYPEELNLHTAYWWSPDSSKIAYLQFDEKNVTRYPMVDYLSVTGETHWERYPKTGGDNPIVHVVVVTVGGASAFHQTWVNTGPDMSVYIPRVEWLPDSKALAIQRLNRKQNKLDLLIADAVTGRSQAVLSEEDKYWINVLDDLYFFGGGKRFLWGSERDGFHHLYLYDLISAITKHGALEVRSYGVKLNRQVTHGQWEVTDVAGVDQAKGSVYFTATEKSSIERHLYVASLEETKVIERLTPEGGTHTINMAPDCAHYVDTYSNVVAPPQQYLNTADGKRVAVIEENRVAELADYGLQAPRFYTVPGADGTSLNAMLLLPPDFDPSKKYPVIVFLYGGPESQVVLNQWGGTTALWHQMMARKGFIIFSVDNRGMAGRGHAFETPIYHHFGRDALADQLAALNWLKANFPVDESRVGIWGWSFGGYMTCYAMFNAPDVFKAGFAGSPVTDYREYDTIYTERYMGTPQENPEGYRDSSPVNQAANLKGKLMIAYGTGDDNVHFANTVELSEQFIRAGKYAEMYMYPNRGHGISDPAARIHLFNRVTQFFVENLK